MLLSCGPLWPFLTQESPPITVHPEEHATYLVDVTYSVPDSEAVYLLRPYEIVVRPRDRFLNDLPDEEIETGFTARFSGEFDRNLPGLTDIWSSTIPVTGWMHAILSSRFRRLVEDRDDLQWIEAYDPDQPDRSGRATFQIFDHAPFAPRLLAPQDRSNIKLWSPKYTEAFSWEDLNPRDPYDRIQISRFDSTRVSDEVHFIVHFLDAVSLTRGMQLESDQDGAMAVATISHKWLFDLIDQISGFPTTKEVDLVWYVRASDGLYETESLPPENNHAGRPGFRLKIEKVGDLVAALPEAEHFNLSQNYPNPFHESTVVPVELRAAGFVRLRVYNLIGEEVAMLHNGMLPAGAHTFRFERGALPGGVYVYRLESGKQTLVRRMLSR